MLAAYNRREKERERETKKVNGAEFYGLLRLNQY
jgi:hypothetical protein